MFLTGSSTHMFACIDGRLHGWGRLSVALGLDRRSITTEPTPVERLGRMHHPGGIPEELIYDVAVGAGHSLVLATSGEVFAGGSNSRGQLGMGSQNNPFELFTLERSEDTSGIRFTAGGCGLLHSALVSADGGIYTTGQNEQGQLGVAGREDRFRLTRVTRGSVVSARVVTADCGGESSYCLTEDERVHAAGSNRFGQLGLGALPGSEEFAVVPLPSGRFARQLAVGERHVLVLCQDGAVVGWGENSLGQVLPGAKGDHVREPRVLDTLANRNVLALAVGRAHNVLVIGSAAAR